MSRIDDLISELAPQGVQFRALGELLNYEQPGKYLVQSANYDASFATPVLTAGQTFVLGHTDETTGIYPASPEGPVMIFDDFTTAFKWVDFPFKAKSSAMKMLTPKPGVSLRYLWFAMQTIRYSAHEHARQWIATYSGFRVPVPPLEVQREIVRVLDQFTELEAQLEAELKAELEARRLQHAHYHRTMLARANAYPRVRIENVTEFINAKPHEKLVDPSGSIALMTSRFISTEGRSARYVRAEDVLTPARKNDVALVMSDLPNGRALAKAFFVGHDDKYAANQRVCLLRSRDHALLLPRFLYYSINRNEQLLAYDSGVDQTHLKKDYILKVEIGLPPLAEQQSIIAALDSFDSLVNDLSAGLPAELTARRQQYEYYRDRLLTFEEASA